MSVRLRVLILTLPLLLAACTGADNPAATTPTPAPEATPSAQATTTPNQAAPEVSPTAQAAAIPTQTTPAAAALPDEPDGDRIKSIVSYLSVDIGPRPAGTAKEKEAADYIAGLLRSYGYEVELQEFSLGRDVARDSTVSITGANARTLSSVPLSNSASGSASGQVVFGGLGKPEEIPSNARSAILLLQRGELTFQQKIDNAQAAGARAVIVFNNEGGNFFGSLASPSSVPAVSISQEQGQALRSQIQAGGASGSVSVEGLSDAKSHNVVAKPPGKDCETVSGGHYDSVQIAPGASDNATGTATIIEVAALLASHGEMGSNCFVLWGAEELGLIGSRAYVDRLSSTERQRLKAVINYDMVGVGSDGWLLAGSASLQQRAQEVATSLGMQTRLGQLGSNTSSDHASFINAGIPAVMLHRTTDNLLHTPQDVVDRVQADLLEQAARLAVTMLEQLNRGS